ncbi:MAG: hypothetical protein K6V36_15030 [Anaerolineae bacterium]|nr:hypothetical protein [Anaerolineae bacterium]
MAARQWLRRGLIYLVWTVLLLAGLWLLLLSREVFVSVFALLYAGGPSWLRWRVSFLEKAFLLAAALLWMAFMVLSEAYLESGMRKGRLSLHVARLAGPELVAVGTADLLLLLLQHGAAWLRWLILGIEFAAGGLLVWWAWFAQHREAPRLRPSTGP